MISWFSFTLHLPHQNWQPLACCVTFPSLSGQTLDNGGGGWKCSFVSSQFPVSRYNERGEDMDIRIRTCGAKFLILNWSEYVVAMRRNCKGVGGVHAIWPWPGYWMSFFQNCVTFLVLVLVLQPLKCWCNEKKCWTSRNVRT